MTSSRVYLAGDNEEYTMEDMVNRVVYWWARYEGKRTEDGKDFSTLDVKELAWRLKHLTSYPEDFRFNNPNMQVDTEDNAFVGVDEE